MESIYYKRGIATFDFVEACPGDDFSDLKKRIIQASKVLDSTVQADAPLFMLYPVMLSNGRNCFQYIEVISSLEEPRPEFQFLTIKVDSLSKLRISYPLIGSFGCPFTVGRRAAVI